MDKETAAKILGDAVQSDGSLYDLGGYIAWNVGDDEVCLDGDFETETIIAVSWWVDNVKA